MLFITHQIPNGLQVDEVLSLSQKANQISESMSFESIN
jgi:hypothetical protein